LGFPLGPDERVPLALSLARLRVADLEHDGPGAGRAFANLTPHRFACLFLNAATLQAFEQNFDVLRRPGANYKRGATAFATEEFGIGAHGEGQLQPYRLDQAGWRENHLDLAVRRNTKFSPKCGRPRHGCDNGDGVAPGRAASSRVSAWCRAWSRLREDASPAGWSPWLLSRLVGVGSRRLSSRRSSTIDIPFLLMD
jgi:hypothetical protein